MKWINFDEEKPSGKGKYLVTDGKNIKVLKWAPFIRHGKI